ncbi:hypothetical protein ACFLSJ_01140 [Verrucomicrobiota bacterium]
MSGGAPQPEWDAADPAGSLRAFAEWLHGEARGMFARDGTHGHLLFLFDERRGLVSMNPVPPKTEPEQLLAGVRQAVRQHGLFGVVSVAEAWVYCPSGPRDHTLFQLRDGETRAADLNEGDRREALLVELESRGGDRLTWLSPILREGDGAALGEGTLLPKGKRLKRQSWFD